MSWGRGYVFISTLRSGQGRSQWDAVRANATTRGSAGPPRTSHPPMRSRRIEFS